MKTLIVRDTDNRPVKGWQFGTFRNYLNVGIDKPRRISGWMLVAPDGYERLCEGNWQQFVPFVQLIMENHGYKCVIS